MSIFDQYKQTANTQTNAIQSFGNNLFNRKQPVQPFTGPIGMTPYQNPPQQSTPTQQAPAPVQQQAPRTTTQNTSGYSDAYLQGQQWINNFNNQQQAPTNSNLADTPISNFYAPSPTQDTYTPYQDVDEDKIRRDMLQRYQGQIDATKAVYSRLLGDTQLQGTGRLGESTAMQARGGLMGSDFGAAQTDKTRQFNQSQEEKVLESQATAIASIMAQAQGDAQAAINSQRAAKQYGYESLKEWNQQADARKQANLNKVALSLLRQSVDPRTMNKEQLKELAKNYKVSEADIINSYLEQEANQVSEGGEFATASAGSAIYDKRTGEMISLVPNQGGVAAGGKIVKINGRDYVQNPDGTFSTPDVPGGGPMLENTFRAATTVVRDVTDALQKIDESFLFDGSGIMSANARAASSKVAGTKAYEINQLIDSVKANIGIDTLLNIKASGAGLGQVPQSQLETLQSVLGNLKVSRDPELLKRDLEDVQRMYQEIVQKAQAEMSSGMSTGGNFGESDNIFAEEW